MHSTKKDIRLMDYTSHLFMSLFSIISGLLAVFLYQQFFLSETITLRALGSFFCAWFDWIILIPTMIYLIAVYHFRQATSSSRWIIIVLIGLVYGYIEGFIIQQYIGPFCAPPCFSGILLPHSFMHNSGMVFGITVTIVYIISYMLGRRRQWIQD